MGYPDSIDSDPWPSDGTAVNHVTLYNNTTAKLNTLVPRVADSGWVVPTLGNSWTNLAGGNEVAGYRLKSGIVYIGGVIKTGTVAATIFTLPAGMRPLGQIIFVVAANAGAAIIGVSSAGAVSVNSYIASGTSAFVSLNGVQFVAEQ